MSLPMLELVLVQQSEWLLATLSGAASGFTEHMDCWQRIARALQGSGALQLIVQDDSLGASMSRQEVAHLVEEASALLPANIPIAYVLRDIRNIGKAELAALQARKHGHDFMVFGDRDTAERWLRYGEHR